MRYVDKIETAIAKSKQTAVPPRSLAPVSLLRHRLDLSEDKFAAVLHVPTAMLKGWELGASRPSPIAQALIDLINDDPERSLRVLSSR